ncbi:MAG: type III-B CRISPR-associated protein Cas10/Cmr2 [Acidobacteriota bacterium]|nr:type III-B CRISPR-associated protein Cas10/Cmr2 [Acidobacteriota bacterium]
MSEEWLLKWGLAGVQEFISQATKVRELAAGSRIVALVARAAGHAAEEAGAEIVLPQAGGRRYWPHQAVVRLSQGSRQKAAQLGSRMTETAKLAWEELASEERGSLPRMITILAEPDVVASQTAQALETYWVAVPVNGSYREAFDSLLSAYEDRRWTRDFLQNAMFSDPEHQPWCCSQCGTRPAVVQPPSGGWPEAVHFASKAERLCAVCVAKRQWSAAELGGEFPSTHRLARSRFLRDPTFTPLLAVLGTGARFLDDLDETRKLLVSSTARSADDMQTLVLEALRAQPLLLERLLRLSPYYAIVVCDGDRMGRWFSGEFFADSTDTRPHQEVLSRSLFAFADAIAQDIEPFEKFGARLVYAGGDDALLLLPLDFLLPVVQLIGRRWQGLRDAVQKLVEPGSPLPTLSLHASVLHAKAPLQPAVHRLHELLDVAKDRGRRNCVSVHCAIQAGAEAHWIGRWEEVESLSGTVEAFSSWRRHDVSHPGRMELDARRGSRLSTSLLHACLEASPAFLSPGMPGAAFRREINRLWIRSDSPANDAVREWLFDRASGKALMGTDIEAGEALASTIEVVAFLARELAWENQP